MLLPNCSPARILLTSKFLMLLTSPPTFDLIVAAKSSAGPSAASSSWGTDVGVGPVTVDRGDLSGVLSFLGLFLAGADPALRFGPFACFWPPGK